MTATVPDPIEDVVLASVPGPGLVTGSASAAGSGPRAAAEGPGSLRSVSRAFQALEFVASHQDGATAKEIAAHLRVALPSVYHLLTTLVGNGYLVHLASDHRYGLGYQVRVLDQGLAHQLEAPAGVAAVIQRLHVDADAAAYYAVYREADPVVAHVADSPRRPRVQALDIGFHEAVHATAFGKVMLAAMESSLRSSYLDRAGLRRCTPRTIVNRESLELHLAHVRNSQVALEIGEFQDGLSCLAAPVRSPAGAVVASVAISLASADFAARRWSVERAVRASATSITRALRAQARDCQ